MKANEPLSRQGTESNPEGYELATLLGRAFDEKPLWVALYESVRDALSPKQLPPLELTSTPIPLPDRGAAKRNATAFLVSIGINAGIVLLFLFAFHKQITTGFSDPRTTPVDVDLSIWRPPALTARDIGGGGGGGERNPIDAIQGRTPKQERDPLLSPQIVRNAHPRLRIEEAVEVQPEIRLPDNPTMATIGVNKSPNVTLDSAGPGGPGGIGSGHNHGLGPGGGPGSGPGCCGNFGGNLSRIGQGVAAPVPIYEPDAEFSDEARRSKYEGSVLVTLIVDARGEPQNVHVVRSLGMGLDEKALAAVLQYRFKPAMDKAAHRAVAVPMNVEVRFRLY